MTIIMPDSIDDVLAALASADDTVVLAGGTDLMVSVNDNVRTLDSSTVVALGHVADLATWTVDPAAKRLRLGACVTWSELESETLRSFVPALGDAARTVGSPQIRHVGTIGGNLATCSPAGDGLPVLAALDAELELRSVRGTRRVPIVDFMVGVKRTVLDRDELIVSVTVPLLTDFQGYAKVGVRNAMVISTASACVVVDSADRSVRIALGSVAPTVLRCPEAESFAAWAAPWDDPGRSIDPEHAAEAGRLAAMASHPIDDHRSTAAYRRHAVGVLVRRLLTRGFPGRSEVGAA